MFDQILTGAPWYAYVILPVLIGYGWLQSRTRAMGKVKVLMLPIIMTILSAGGVIESFGPHVSDVVAWLIGFTLAAVVNQVVRAPAGVSYDTATKRFHVPGTWTPLVLMMVIYVAKYVVGVAAILAPEMLVTSAFVVSLSLVFGGACGVFFGRFLCTWSTSLRVDPVAGASLEHSA